MTPIPTPSFERSYDPRDWSKALVYGLGISGRAAVRLLAARGVEVYAVDDMPDRERAARLGAPEAPGRVRVLQGPEAPAEVPAGVEGLVLSPGIPADRPLLQDARRRSLPVLPEVEVAWRHARGPLVGITGSNGKSTTTALAAAILQAAGEPAALCGNIGKAFSEAVLEAGGEERVWVVELSSFQLEAVRNLRPAAAAYLNLAPDHMNRHGSLEAYAAAKERLLARMGPGDVAVLNLDDPRVMAASTRARKRFFTRRSAKELAARGPRSLVEGCHLEGDRVLEVAPGREPEELFRRQQLQLAGEHNLENAMAAALLARALGARPEDVVRALEGFSGLPHRMERVAEDAGITYWDDSKGTNPAATLRSLEGLEDGTVHLILGGRAKGTDFAEMGPLVARKARRVYLIGEASETIAEDLRPWTEEGSPGRPNLRISSCGTLDEAVAEAHRRARPGEAVLLSPACASFDQFESFAQRGDTFQRLVRRAVDRAADTGEVPRG